MEWRDIAMEEDWVYGVSLVKLLDGEPLTTKITNLSKDYQSWGKINYNEDAVRLKDVICDITDFQRDDLEGISFTDEDGL